MVNYERIVPIQKIDFLSLIGTIINIFGDDEITLLESIDVDGNFQVDTAGGYLANQPVKAIDFSSDGSVMFVASTDFETITYNGEPLTLGEGSLELSDIKRDGITLYSVTVETDGSTVGFIKQITPEL